MDKQQAAREMETVMRALAHVQLLLRGHDQMAAATELADQTRYSPLRTLVEQATTAGGEIMQFLREDVNP